MGYSVAIDISPYPYVDQLTDTTCGTVFYLQNGEENDQDVSTLKEIPR